MLPRRSSARAPHQQCCTHPCCTLQPACRARARARTLWCLCLSRRAACCWHVLQRGARARMWGRHASCRHIRAASRRAAGINASAWAQLSGRVCWHGPGRVSRVTSLTTACCCNSSSLVHRSCSPLGPRQFVLRAPCSYRPFHCPSLRHRAIHSRPVGCAALVLGVVSARGARELRCRAVLRWPGPQGNT